GRGAARRASAAAVAARGTFNPFRTGTRGAGVNRARPTRSPKLERTLPSYLDRAEIETLFGEAERRARGGGGAGGFRGARDLAMLELFYSTGMRLAELVGLNDADLDLVSDQVKVRGKGKKERIVPVGSHAGVALRRYFRRRDAVLTGDRRAVFLSRRGAR